MSVNAVVAPPAGPLTWPFPVLWLADHWSRDYANYWRQMARVTDPVEAAQAEGALGANLIQDSLTAWADFWSIPLRVWDAAYTTTHAG
jgi:hypothetical protein